MTHLEPLNVYRQYGDEERMDQKPMRYEYDNRKGAELSNSPSRKTRNQSQDGVVCDNFECVGGPRDAQSYSYAFLDRESDVGLDNFFDLFDNDGSMMLHQLR